MTLTSETRVRFVADSRHGDWRKGQYGVIEKVLALPPQNQSALYVIRTDDAKHRHVLVWATERDIEPVLQLTIFDELVSHVLPSTTSASSDTQ